MLAVLLIVLTGGALLGIAGILSYRKRHLQVSPDGDAEDVEGVAPLLIVPQTRNNTSAQVRTAPARPAVRARPVRQYIAPLSGVAAEGTLQLWPGRLEPADGGGEEEIRFIRTPGVNRFTFGRSAGPANTHVQLLAPTASRMHAYMVVENGRWRIGNMSETNRVLVNGVALETADAERWLADGDRIELGEVSFIFRER